MDSTTRRGFIRSVTAAAGAVGAGSLGAAGATPAQAQAPGALPFSTSPLAKAGGHYVNPNRVLLWENTRKEIRQLLADGRLKAAILPTGSVEQHNEHLALACDIANSSLVAQQVALELYPQAIVAPPSPCGYSPYWMARKGTITLRKETLLAYVYDVLSSLKAHGIRTILMLNGHGGNHGPLREALPGWRKELGITLDADSYWSGIPRDKMLEVMETESGVSHAAEFETSLFMAAFPERVRSVSLDEYDSENLNYESGYSPEVIEYLGKDDAKGENERDRSRQKEALLASAAKGQELIWIATRSFADRLTKMIAATEAGTSWPPA